MSQDPACPLAAELLSSRLGQLRAIKAHAGSPLSWSTDFLLPLHSICSPERLLLGRLRVLLEISSSKLAWKQVFRDLKDFQGVTVLPADAGGLEALKAPGRTFSSHAASHRLQSGSTPTPYTTSAHSQGSRCRC